MDAAFSYHTRYSGFGTSENRLLTAVGKPAGILIESTTHGRQLSDKSLENMVL